MEIAVLNYSTRVTDEDAGWMVRACNYQMIKHLAPAYGREPWTMQFYSDISGLPIGSCYPMILLDNSDVKGALGYHTDDDQGFIYSRIFAAPTMDNGGNALTGEYSVASILSHEMCEMFADPEANLWANGPPIKGGNQYAYEISDPVERDQYDITVGAIWQSKQTVSVSNFVKPNWFKVNATSDFDYMDKLKAPFTMTTGGYMVVRDSTGTETNVFGDVKPPQWRLESKKHKMARTARRGVK